MLHICPRLPHQPFVEPPFEKEILAFLRFLRHSAVIRKLTDVEHKDTKKSNEMYYPRFMKVIIHHFMSKDPSIPRRNKVNWHYVRDDHMFSTIKLVSRHQNTLQFGALLPIELTNKDIRNSKAYKEYYAVATGVTSPRPKASVWKTRSSSDTNITPPTTVAGPRLTTSEKGKQAAKASKAKNSDEEEFIHPSLSTHAEEEPRDEESFDPISKTPKDTDDEGNGEENLGINVGREEGHDEEEEEDELYRDVNINQGRGIQMTQEFEDSHVTLTPVNPDGQQQSSSVSSQFVTSMLNPTPDAVMESIFETTSQMDVQTPTSVAPLPILRTLEANFSEFMQSNQFAGAVSAILRIVQRYMDHRMNKAIKVAVQIQSDRLRDEAQKENDEFLKTFAENMQNIIKEQVKEQVKVQVSKILPKIEQTENEQLEAEVLTRSSNSSKTSYAIAADLSEMELKKILIEKMEGNKSIQRSNEKRNLYKALVEAYESDKIILDTYGDIITLKRHRDDDADRDEEPFAGSDRGSKRHREGKELKKPMQTTFEMEEPSHLEFETGADDQPIIQSSQHLKWFSQQQKPPTPNLDTLTSKLLAGPTYKLMKGSCKSLVELEYHLEEVYKATTDQLDWFNPEGQQYPHNFLKPLTLIPNNRGRRVILFDHFINNDLEYLRRGALSRKYTTSVTKTKAADYGHIKWIEDLVPRTMWIQEPIGYDKHALWGISHWGRKRQQFYGFAVNQESARDVYSKQRIIVVTELKIVEWHNYKHLDWITVQRDDDKLYMFKEGDFKWLRIQDIEDIIIIQRRVEDLQLGVESYQKKLNLTRPDMYRSDLKRKEAYIAYSNPRGFIYQNKDKHNRLMRIDELHKFRDGMLTDVRTALDDRLKGIRIQYLPQSIWRKSDKDRAAAMIYAIDKRLKTRRIMRSLKRFVGGRLYEGDFRMLQRTI
nr:hypothetical protein [Tanacetum cinerariifolium]